MYLASQSVVSHNLWLKQIKFAEFIESQILLFNSINSIPLNLIIIYESLPTSNY